MTFKTSFDDLRDPNGRQNLRQHFTGAFPETQVRPSLESMTSSDADSRPALSRSASNLTVEQASIAALSSTSSESLNSPSSKRLSTVRESNSAIDVMQAIKLLEELKKTASAAELVALHKALLPSRDSGIHSAGLPSSQEDLTNMSATGFVRRRSMLPPGVATRNASTNLFRTPEEAAVESSAKRASTRSRRKKALAVEHVMEEDSSTNMARAATPDFPMGAYGRGTLRIMNGSASPEPGQICQGLERGFISSDDYDTAPSSPNNGEDVSSTQRVPLHQQSLDNIVKTLGTMQEIRNAALDALPKSTETETEATESRKSRRFSEPAMSGIPVPEEKDDASPRLYRPTRRDRSKSPHQSREGSRPRTLRSRASSHSQLPVAVESASNNLTSTDSKTDDAKTPRDSASTQSSMPRFAQRWSHRMSFLPSDTNTNDQLPSAPSVNNTALINLSKRLSSVTDNSSKGKEPYQVTVTETPDIALARLNGQLEHPAFRRSSEQEASETRPSADSITDPRSLAPLRPAETKGDSGYGSDISIRSTENSESQERPMVYRQFSHTAPERPLAHRTQTTPPAVHDEVSLYSFNAILKDPALLAGLSTPSPPATRGSRNRLSLLGLGRKKSSPQPGLITNNEALVSSPRDVRPSKSQKRLQKAMPAAVREEMKVSRKKADADRQSKELASIPDVPQDVATSFRRRSQSDAPEHIITEPSWVGLSELLGSVPSELNSDNEMSERIPPMPRPGPTRSYTQPPESVSRETNYETATTPDRRSISGNQSVSSNQSGSTIKASTFGWKSLASDDIASDSATRRSSMESSALGSMTASSTVSSNPSVKTVVQQDISVGKPRPEDHSVAPGNHGATSSNSGAVAGMEASAAAKLARLRSRDIASQSNEDMFEAPKTATPRSRRNTKSPNHSAQSSQGGTNLQRPEGQDSAAEGQSSTSLDRSVSVAESIPPLPQLPANVSTRNSKLDGMVARGDQGSALADDLVLINDVERTRGYSTESVADAVKKARKYQTGYSTESVVDAIKKAQKGRKGHDSGQLGLTSTLDSSDPVKARRSKLKKSKRSRARDDDDSVDEDAGPKGLEAAVEERPTTQPREQSKESSWDEQAEVWRQRRKSAGEALGMPADLSNKENEKPQPQRSSASSVHSIRRKPVPSSNRNSETTPILTHKRSGSAELHAEVYRDLIGRQSKVQSGVEGVGWRDSTGTFATVHDKERDKAEESTTDVPDSAYATKPYQVKSITISRARSPGGRVVTSTGNYHPYSPTGPPESEPDQMKRFRSESLAKLTGATKSTPASPHQAPKRPWQGQQNVSLESLIGRYSGGLNFGYAGLGDSAGTRATGIKGPRKSLEGSFMQGVDFSDVPMLPQTS